MNKINTFFKKIKNNRLIKDSFWSLAGNVVGRGLSLLAGILVARYLGKDLYGEYGIIRNTILTIGVFSSFGLGYTATKYVANLKKKSKQETIQFVEHALGITFIFCFLMAIVLFLMSNYVSTTILEAPHLSSALQILSGLIIFNGLTTTQIGILSGFGKFKEIAHINSIVGVVTFFTSVLFTYFYGLDGALFALLIAQIINWFLNYIIVKKQIKVGWLNIPKWNRALLKNILYFSTPIALQEMVYVGSSLLGSVLLIKFATYGDLGMYSAAMQWNAIILFIPGILRNVVLSHLSENLSDMKTHDKILKTTIVINIVSTAIPALIVALLSGFIQDFYGKSFDGLSSLISLAVFITVFTSVSNVYAQAYLSKGYNWTMLLIRSIRDFGTLLVFAIIVVNYNIIASQAMIVGALSFSIVFLLIIILLYKQLKTKNR